VSVRWRPLLSAHSGKRRTTDKSLTQSFDVLKSSKWRLSSWTFSFAADAVSLQFLTHNSTVLPLVTLSFRWTLKCRRNMRWVTTTEPLFYKYISTAKARCSTDQRSMLTEMLWVSLEGRTRTNYPHQRFQSQLCCQIVSYFCRTMYKHTHRGTAVAQWLRCCATNQKVAGSIPAGVSGFFIDIKSSRSHHGPGVDSA